MAAGHKIPNASLVKIIEGEFDPTNDTMKAMFLTSSHSNDVDNHVFADDISANEVSSSGSYTSGFGNREAATFTTTQDDSNDQGKLEVTISNLTSFTGSILYVAFIKEVTADSDSPIYDIEELDQTYSATNGTWSYTDNASGFLLFPQPS